MPGATSKYSVDSTEDRTIATNDKNRTAKLRNGRQAGAAWGPGNPHALSTRKTELVWEGKYDEHGNRRDGDVDLLDFGGFQRIVGP